ncbi:gamma-glutamyl-gamma-aminobutyrate hydrolase family protein [Syntrophomonas erecta]
MKPVIGITSHYTAEENSYWLRDYYITAVWEAGGVPVIIPPLKSGESIELYLSVCHGFILSGGGDLDPVYWGELPGKGLGNINPLRDSFELLLASQVIEKDRPVLGICRGCQVLNVAAGGSLIQDIESSMSHQQNAPRDYPFHAIVVEKESRLKYILNTRWLRVNSFHHQAVKHPGRGLKVSARAADGIVEAIEGIDHTMVVGVQWHPECMHDEYARRLFQKLVEAAGADVRREDNGKETV